MKPEDRAREEIDRQLTQCGWLVQDQATINIMSGPGVAVREGPLLDYQQAFGEPSKN